eukprot:scaffold2224_cov261-Pinguiococcus_pyrenoidosus.AAC.2
MPQVFSTQALGGGDEGGGGGGGGGTSKLSTRLGIRRAMRRRTPATPIAARATPLFSQWAAGALEGTRSAKHVRAPNAGEGLKGGGGARRSVTAGLDRNEASASAVSLACHASALSTLWHRGTAPRGVAPERLQYQQ